jgi:hypothetical protein
MMTDWILVSIGQVVQPGLTGVLLAANVRIEEEAPIESAHDTDTAAIVWEHPTTASR